jgi:glycosyltransferase involved in cell wall biosynthesis
MLSVVIPAFNEEKLLGACIDGVRSAFAAQAAPPDHEIVVCDNNSSDSTAAVAASRGVKCVFEPLNRIAGARNSGAAAAAGDWLLFLDADSSLRPATLRAALEMMASGAYAGGGALVAFEPAPPAWGRALTGLWNLISRAFRLAPGSFLFCRRDLFIAAGGFSPRLYAGEELALSRAIGRLGGGLGLRFGIITSAPHVSSARKFELYTFAELMLQGLRFLARPFSSVKDPARLGIFYDGKR